MNQPPETPLPDRQNSASERRTTGITEEKSLRRGRPQGDSDAREALLNTARELFASRPYRTVTLREIARYAGVEAALVRYYFGGKAGLFEAMMRETLAPVLDALRTSGQFRASTGEPPQPRRQVEHVMQTYYRIMGRHPHLPRLVFRILNEGDDLEPFAILSRVFGDVVQASDVWIKNALLIPGELEQNVNPEFARLSFISLMVFPLVAPPLVLRRIGISVNPDTLTALASHNSRLFSQGVFTHSASTAGEDASGEILT
ncbi:MAG: TetR/AcrR family transcriptional regulator [Saccharospirillaceae bacterium]|nr:TetR/AcrR family transcriptional regulator [Saccharospirillaceae bacterium]MCD8530280.1 TetR/AcrR family transcriptional regulator [Saccharospirillaceae bacterium]